MIIHVWKMLINHAHNIEMTFYQHERHGTRANVPAYNYKAQNPVASAYDFMMILLESKQPDYGTSFKKL